LAVVFASINIVYERLELFQQNQAQRYDCLLVQLFQRLGVLTEKKKRLSAKTYIRSMSR
jgi:hypothetical protein